MAAAQAHKEISFLYLSALKPAISSRGRGRKCLKKLQSEEHSGKLIVRDGWVTCPSCRRNRHLLRIGTDTMAQELPVYCRDCKTEVILNIEKGQSVERRSQ